jgi:DNA-binding CsgD family transcriptional regulator
MTGLHTRSFFSKALLPNGKAKLSDKSTEIFRQLSSGLSEETILQTQPLIDRLDIVQAAREALILNQAVQVRDERSDKVMRQYPRAYDKWSPDEERRVAEMYNSGKTMREIAATVLRQPNAIKNRLEKMGWF